MMYRYTSNKPYKLTVKGVTQLIKKGDIVELDIKKIKHSKMRNFVSIEEIENKKLDKEIREDWKEKQLDPDRIIDP